MKEESEPMRGRWSGSNFPPAWHGEVEEGEIHHPGDISYQAASHLSSSLITTHATYCILGGVASLDLIFGQTIAVSTEAKV